MKARVVSAQCKPGKVADAIEVYRNLIEPAARQQTGLKGALFLTDPSTGKATSISIWETEADMLAGESSSYLQEQIAKLGPFLASTPVSEHYDVSYQY